MGIDEQLPTIAIVTHYDTFGIAPVRLQEDDVCVCMYTVTAGFEQPHSCKVCST